MKKYLLITPIFLLLAGAGCQPSNSTNVNTNAAVTENTNVAVVENTNVETSSDVDTSDWKTYTNDEYGFSFKYPSDWSVDVLDETDEGGMGVSVGDIIFKADKCRAQSNELNLGTINNLTLDLQRYDEKRFEKISSNGISGIKYFDVVNENDYKGYIYMFSIGGYELSFNIVDHPDNDSCQLTFKKIMDSITNNS